MKVDVIDYYVDYAVIFITYKTIQVCYVGDKMIPILNSNLQYQQFFLKRHYRLTYIKRNLSKCAYRSITFCSFLFVHLFLFIPVIAVFLVVT